MNKFEVLVIAQAQVLSRSSEAMTILYHHLIVTHQLSI